jgi:glutaredoxin 3
MYIFWGEAYMKKCLFLLTALVFFLLGTANAAFYSWEDESGATQITNYPPPQSKSGQKVKVYKFNDDSSAVQEDQETKAPKKPNVVLYTKNNCADCDKARGFLKSKNMSFTEYNIDRDKEALTKRKEIDDSEDVPFAIINRNQVYGFSEAVYNRALKLNP